MSDNVDKQKWELELSDRTNLIREANVLIGTMVLKQKPGGIYGEQSIGQNLNELTQEEADVYNSALRFLAKQFNQGAIKTTSHLVENQTSRVPQE